MFRRWIRLLVFTVEVAIFSMSTLVNQFILIFDASELKFLSYEYNIIKKFTAEIM